MTTSSRTVSRLSRILALIPFVLESGSVNVAEVLERFGYTKDQLARDLNTVFVCGLPGYGPGDLMEAYIDEDQVVIDAADYFTRAPRLTPTEALGLLAAGLTVLASGEGGPALESAVKKLTKVVIPDAEQSVAVEVPREAGSVSVLTQAASEHRVVGLTYRSVGKEETTRREVEPRSVFATLGRWYVTGFCRLAGEERTFRVDRIRDLSISDETFRLPTVIPEPWVGYSPSPGDVVAEIDLGVKARWVIEYYPVEVVSEGKNSVRIRFYAPDPEVPARLLLRLGDGASLINGDEVAERVQRLGSELLDSYR